MTDSGRDAVTGAFSFTGGFIARRLLAAGRRVRTLTNHPHRTGAEPMDVEIAPLQFADRDALIESLRGIDVLYNTYWIRFPHAGTGFGDAIANTRKLMGAAAAAGVRKVIHISVSNPTDDSPLDYYAGKARTEAVVRESAGEDVADIAIWAAGEPDGVTVDAAGPDIISYAQLVDGVAIAIGHTRPIVFASPALTLFAGRVLGRFVKDVILTPQELAGLMDELLVSTQPPRGRMRIEDWLLRSADSLGVRYASELDRHFRRAL